MVQQDNVVLTKCYSHEMPSLEDPPRATPDVLSIGRVILIRTKSDELLREIVASGGPEHAEDRDLWLRDAQAELEARAKGEARQYSYEELRALSVEAKQALVQERDPLAWPCMAKSKCCKFGCGALLSSPALPFCDEHMKDPQLLDAWNED